MKAPTGHQGLLIAIPTRNRARLAMSAIQSVLDQITDDIQVMVSDNSTLPEESAELFRFCRQTQDARLRYVAPPEPLSMTQHWDWVLQLALSQYSASHFTFLTDRMVFKPDALKSLIAHITVYPNRLLCYMHD